MEKVKPLPPPKPTLVSPLRNLSPTTTPRATRYDQNMSLSAEKENDQGNNISTKSDLPVGICKQNSDQIVKSSSAGELSDQQSTSIVKSTKQRPATKPKSKLYLNDINMIVRTVINSEDNAGNTTSSGNEEISPEVQEDGGKEEDELEQPVFHENNLTAKHSEGLGLCLEGDAIQDSCGPSVKNFVNNFESAHSNENADNTSSMPVKPPRNKRQKKISCDLPGGGKSSSFSGKCDDLHPTNTAGERIPSPRPKPKPRTSLSKFSEARAVVSDETDRMVRSASYERALEDDLIARPNKLLVSEEKGSSDGRSQSVENLSVTEKAKNRLSGSHDNLHIAEVEIKPLRPAPPPPTKKLVGSPIISPRTTVNVSSQCLDDNVYLSPVQLAPCCQNSSSGDHRVSENKKRNKIDAGKIRSKEEQLKRRKSTGSVRSSSGSVSSGSFKSDLKRSSRKSRESNSIFYVNTPDDCLSVETAPHLSQSVSDCGPRNYMLLEGAKSPLAIPRITAKEHSLETFIPLNGEEESEYTEINELDLTVPPSSDIYSEPENPKKSSTDDEGYSLINHGDETVDPLDETVYIYSDAQTNPRIEITESSPNNIYHLPSEDFSNSESKDHVEVAENSGTKSSSSRSPRASETSYSSDEDSGANTRTYVNLERFSSSVGPADRVPRRKKGSGKNEDCVDGRMSNLDEEEKEKIVDKKKRKAHLVAKEIVSSEETFVDVLRLINKDFLDAIERENKQVGHQIVAPNIVGQIIKYLPDLQKFNEDLLQDLKARLSEWENNPRLADIFVKKGPFLKLYTNYIREFNTMVALLDETRRKNAEFDKVVTEFENAKCPLDANFGVGSGRSGPSLRNGPSGRGGPGFFLSPCINKSPAHNGCAMNSSRCAKLALKHYMLKPIQRIPQYRLLLRDYSDQLLDDSPDYKDATVAIQIVHEVAEHANQSMKYGDDLNKLLEIQNSLIGQFEVIVPGRTLVKDGILMKLSRKEMQPRMFYLFSDVLLYTSPVNSGFKLNNVMPLNGVKVSRPTKEDFQNEFSIISTQRSFTVTASSEQERIEWLTALEGAIAENMQRRYSYSQGRGKLSWMHSIVSIECDANDFKVGTKAPVWIPDDRVSMCMVCMNEFTVSFRRHHCRGCGKVVCSGCSDWRAPLQYLTFRQDRVCQECHDTLLKETLELPDDAPPPKKDEFSKGKLLLLFKGRGQTGAPEKTNLKRKPAVLQEVQASDENVDMSGYLHVWKVKRWKRLWFVLKGNVLYTYKASEDAAAEESSPLLGYEVMPFTTYFQGIESNLVFELGHRGMPSMIFRTESPLSREKWMCAMRKATVP